MPRRAVSATARPTRTTSGTAAYRWLLERLRPPLWLHGHTTRASVPDWRAALGTSIVANVTGSVLVELVPPPD